MRARRQGALEEMLQRVRGAPLGIRELCVFSALLLHVVAPWSLYFSC